MSDAFLKYEPEVAARMFDAAPEKTWFPIAGFPGQFGLSREEVLEELKSGRLVATGQPTSTGYANIAIRGDNLIQWINTRSAAVAKALWHIQSKRETKPRTWFQRVDRSSPRPRPQPGSGDTP